MDIKTRPRALEKEVRAFTRNLQNKIYLLNPKDGR